VEIVLVLLSVALVAALVAVAVLVRRLRRVTAEGRETLAAAATALGRSAGSAPDAVRALAMQRDDAISNREFIRSVVEGLSVGVMVIGPGNEPTFSTALARRLLEGGPGAAGAAVRLRDLADQVAATGDGREARLDGIGPQLRSYRAEADPLPAELGPGVVIRIADVTDQERVDRMRRDFVANVSHELKTPVGALAVLAEALEEAEDPEVRRRLTGRIHGEARRVATLVDEILDLSALESELPEMTAVDVGEAVGEAVRRVAVAADDAGTEIAVVGPESPTTVTGDRTQLVSAIANLLDNAVKYSSFRPGSGRVRVRTCLDGDHVAIDVEDDGIGIAERHRSRIFERFYRIDAGRGRSHGGTGLGLAIVRHVAVNHGGTIEVESTPGVGSVFRLRLPLKGT
jgi:two-component system sensor histidine kinase SenX3